MSFSENLQTLRKARGISQEQLAERLDVSRQAVSKWETDGGYPEIEKIMSMCEIFGCTMDELMMGRISVDKNDLRQKRERHYNRFSVMIATGVLLILLGVASYTVLPEYVSESAIALMTAFMFVLFGIAVFLFIVGGIEHSEYIKGAGSLPPLYSPEECERYNTRVFPLWIGGGVGAIFIGLICTIVSTIFQCENIGAALFLALLGAGCFMFVYGGIRRAKYDIKGFNKESRRSVLAEEEPADSDTPEVARFKARESLSRKICATVMLSCTAVYLLIGFVFNVWTSWAVFPIGGIACAIVSVILGTTK